MIYQNGYIYLGGYEEANGRATITKLLATTLSVDLYSWSRQKQTHGVANTLFGVDLMA
jgi:hypothetical protein